MSTTRKGYDLRFALAMSREGMAERPVPLRGPLPGMRTIIAMQTAVGVRIVKNYTDPTVVRKLNDKDWASEWFPVGKVSV